MGEQPDREDVLGARLADIRHSAYTEPILVIEGLAPAEYRSHYLLLESGLVLQLSIGGIGCDVLPVGATAGETMGLPVGEVLGRRIAGLARDDVGAPIVLLEGELFLKDASDVCGNPLWAGRLAEEYDTEARSTFVDYWSEEPFAPSDEARD